MGARFSAVTADRIRKTASTPGQLAIASVYENLPSIMNDFRLASLPFKTESIEQIILGVMLMGTQSQKSAMMKYLPMEAGLAFPEIHKIYSGDINRWEFGISFISAQIEKLAGFIGCTIPGDIRDLSERILENFGGLTPVDIVRFFNMCRDGEFRSEFQNVAVRGINGDFLIDWLNQYCEKRELIWLNLVKDSKENQTPDSTAGGVERPAELIEREKRIAGLERDAQQRRIELDSELVEIAHVEYWTKPVTMEAVLDDGRKVKRVVQMPCDPDDPERAEREILPYKKDKPGAQYKRLRFFVETFITLGDNPEPFLKKLIDGWKVEFECFEQTGITFEDYARTESAKFVNAGKRMFSKISATEIIRRALSQKTGHPEHALTEPAQKVTKQIFTTWADYLEASLAHPDAYPLKVGEFMIQRALMWAKQSGFPVKFETELIPDSVVLQPSE